MARYKKVTKHYIELVQADVVDAIFEAKEPEIRSETARKADEFVDTARGAYYGVGTSRREKEMAYSAAAVMGVKDAGKVFKRRKVVKGTKILAQLIRFDDGMGSWMAGALEYGVGNQIRPHNVLARTVLRMGGRLAKKGA